jgi:hypothetical protein
MNRLVTRVGTGNELNTKVRIRNVRSILSNIFEVQGAGVVEGAWVVKGDWDGSTNLFPSNVLKGWQYKNTANSTTLLMQDGGIIPAGAIIVAKFDAPGQTVSNWYIFLSVE